MSFDIPRVIWLLEVSRDAAIFFGVEHAELFPYLPDYDAAIEYLRELDQENKS